MTQDLLKLTKDKWPGKKIVVTSKQLLVGTNGATKIELHGLRRGLWYDFSEGVGGNLLTGLGLVSKSNWRKPVSIYEYRSANGDLSWVAARHNLGEDRKEFRPLAMTNSEILTKRPAEAELIYNRHLIDDDKHATVIITEGEKAADKINSEEFQNETQDYFRTVLGITGANGAQSIPKHDWACLNGRHVIVWPDNDQAGMNCMTLLTDRLREIGVASLRRVTMPASAPAGWDVADGPPEGSTWATLVEDVLNAPIIYVRNLGVNSEKVGIVAKPFTFRDPSTIPRREFLFGSHLIRKYVSATVAPGGIGKSTLAMAEALDMVTGGKILGVATEKLVVWCINGEDPEDEIERKLVALMVHYKIDPSEVDGRLFINSGRLTDFAIAEEGGPGGVKIMQPVVDAMILEIRKKSIDVLQVDPFVSAHKVNENDNNKIDQVTKTFTTLAETAGVAVELIHHVRKPNGSGEITANDSRGASALINTARSVRVLNRAEPESAAFLVKPGEDFNHRSYFRVSPDKENLSPPSERDDWHRIVNLKMTNGDNVGVIEKVTTIGVLDFVTERHLSIVQSRLLQYDRGMASNKNANDWVGNLVAEVVGFDIKNKATKKRVQPIIDIWVKNGALSLKELPYMAPKTGSIDNSRTQERVFAGNLGR